MIEAEWLACGDAREMLPFLQRRAGARKLRLFACACCRRLWDALPAENRAIVEMAEAYADGKVEEEQRSEILETVIGADGADETAAVEDHRASAAYEAATAVWQAGALEPADAAWFVTRCAAAAVADAGSEDPSDAAWQEAERNERATQAGLLRDLFGYPFRPVPMRLEWRVPQVMELAREIYDKGRFDRMPELAALLKQAGCEERRILAHCLMPEPHARGCWVVDGLLGMA